MSVLAKLLGRQSFERITIEPMRRKHLAAIMPIEQASYPRPWTPGVFASEMDLARGGERHYLVARDGNEVVGYAGLMFVIDDAHVTNIAVAASRQRQGIATRLLAELAWEAIARNCQALTLEVRVSNVGAQALYREFGFAPAGVRKKYYENVEDAIVMWNNDLSLPDYREHLTGLCPEAVR
ncbi:MAG: ribosomal protein S18-alanine N-acetyltransferase [Actinomycetota bacterium]|nr:ribosomal protein S18-alanine N-acetyltransferase [Actinomycetota bacterium]